MARNGKKKKYDPTKIQRMLHKGNKQFTMEEIARNTRRKFQNTYGEFSPVLRDIAHVKNVLLESDIDIEQFRLATECVHIAYHVGDLIGDRTNDLATKAQAYEIMQAARDMVPMISETCLCYGKSGKVVLSLAERHKLSGFMDNTMTWCKWLNGGELLTVLLAAAESAERGAIIDATKQLYDDTSADTQPA